MALSRKLQVLELVQMLFESYVRASCWISTVGSEMAWQGLPFA